MNKRFKTVAGLLALTLVFSGGIAIGRENISVSAPVTASADTYESLDYKTVDNEVYITACERNATDVVIPSEIEGLPVTRIEEYAFNNRTNLKSVVIPESVTDIGYNAFTGCSSLTSITIPDGVTVINKETFSGCTSLESVTLSKNLTSIKRDAFSGCTSLVSVTLPESVTTLDDMAFAYCEKLTDITIPTGLINFGFGTFESTPWIEAKRAENPLVIVNNILIDGFTCTGNVVIPDGVTKIGNSAFNNCNAITSVTIPDSVTAIDGYAFYHCTTLKNITIPENVNEIGQLAFFECSGLQFVTIMNPECSIYGNSNTFYKKTILNASENSTAQAYAEKYDFSFIKLGDPLPTFPSVNPTTPKKGDVNEDGFIDTIDATIILRYYAYTSTTNDVPVMTIDEFMESEL